MRQLRCLARSGVMDCAATRLRLSVTKRSSRPRSCVLTNRAVPSRRVAARTAAPYPLSCNTRRPVPRDNNSSMTSDTAFVEVLYSTNALAPVSGTPNVRLTSPTHAATVELTTMPRVTV